MYGSDGLPIVSKPKYTSVHDEENNETFYYADGIEIDPEEKEEEDGS